MDGQPLYGRLSRRYNSSGARFAIMSRGAALSASHLARSAERLPSTERLNLALLAFDVGIAFAVGSQELCLVGCTQVAVSVRMTFLMAGVN